MGHTARCIALGPNSKNRDWLRYISTAKAYMQPARIPLIYSARVRRARQLAEMAHRRLPQERGPSVPAPPGSGCHGAVCSGRRR